MNKNLSDIIKHLKIVKILGDLQVSVHGISIDSRKVQAQYIFCALPGTLTDGHQYISKAIELGARVILCEKLPEKLQKEVTYIQVENAAIETGKLASEFYNRPSERLKLIGVTGTNGKTTIATLLFQLMKKLGYQAGLLSTVANYIQDEEIKATHTTPDALAINELLHLMVEQGCEYCFMEVSSHAIDQDRIAGLQFEGGIFTNITHDHLDYHKTFKNYIQAKKAFFDHLPATSFALINADDKNAGVMVQNTKAKVFSYALQNMADYKCRIIENYFEGMQLEINQREVWTPFIGKFNASNLTAVYAVARLLSFNEEEILVPLSELRSVSGRFETLRSESGKTAIVDYAHTPDALENVLKTIHELRKDQEKIITVLGAGGDRDKSKRPVMAQIALKYSDKVVFTSDNPRTENPDEIIKDMMEGITDVQNKKSITIIDRKEAIKVAVILAASKDIVLVAGKGHENYQEINGVRHHFDDKEIVHEFLNT